MYIPGARSLKTDGYASSFAVDDGHVSFCIEFKYLRSIIDKSLRADADIDHRIASATAAAVWGFAGSGVSEPPSVYGGKGACVRDTGIVYTAIRQ